MEKRCACKGVRSCLLCEGEDPPLPSPTTGEVFVFIQCRLCGRFLEGAGSHGVVPQCPVACSVQKVWRPLLTLEDGLKFSGVTVIQDFITAEREEEIVAQIEAWPWVESQSGRRKQDYGPKVNFKRHKVKLGGFSGLPGFSAALLELMKTRVVELADFVPVEVCNLDYQPERGAAIAPHMDDTWIWGDRLVTLNLLSHSTLTFSTTQDHMGSHTPLTWQVEVYMPRRSLIVVSGNARYQWQHSIQRGHVTHRRIAVTLRELSAEFSPNGPHYVMLGKSLLDTAAQYTGQPTTHPCCDRNT